MHSSMLRPLSSDLSSPKKGLRIDVESNVHESKGWKRHPELYMADGTIVLLANSTVFRVYLGLLSKHSEVFGGMISLSTVQPPNAETYDGCPLVRLTDDAEDLACFLETTMGLHYFRGNQPTSFPCASAVLRLATKYMVAPLRRLAIEHFGRIIPSGFDAIGTEESHGQVFGDAPPHPFALVALFRECQVACFLPWAFYLACKEGFDKLVTGASHNGQAVYMSDEDKQIALFGWKKLRDDTLEIRRTTVLSRAPTCKLGECNNTLGMSWLDTAFYRVEGDSLEPWKLFSLLPRYDDPTTGQVRQLGDSAPCTGCLASWFVLEKQGRKKVWNDLPGYFGLPLWEVLQVEEGNMRHQNT